MPGFFVCLFSQAAGIKKNKLQDGAGLAKARTAQKRKEKTELMSTAKINWDPECGFHMNLQMFADDANNTADSGTAGADNAAAQQSKDGKVEMIPMDQVLKMIQAEADKRVTAALAKQKKAHDREMSLSGLDEQQRVLAERDQTIADLQEQNRTLTIAQNKAELIKTLAGRGLPVEFADVIEVGEDVEKAQQKVNALDAAFKRAVEDAVKTRLAGKTMPGRGGAANSITKAEILAIKDAKERQTAIANNMHLFQKG